MRRPRHSYIVDKAVEAAIGAIEIYNKPSFRYREESFSILMLNAWELLLKARILKDNRNRLSSIQVFTNKNTKSGVPGKRRVPKLNRSKTAMTIGLDAAVHIVRNLAKDPIDQSCANNISMLMEIRDNAIHLFNKSKGLRKKVQEVGAGALRNFSFAVKQWFNRDLSEYDFALLPFAFETSLGVLQAVFRDDSKGAARQLQKYLSDTTNSSPFDPTKPFNSSVVIAFNFVKSSVEGAMAVKIVPPNDSSAVPVTVSEEDLRKQYPWTYDELRRQLRNRYSNFKEDREFHKMRKKIETNQKYCHVRRLDPKSIKSQKKNFYKSGIVNIFDDSYELKKSEKPYNIT